MVLTLVLSLLCAAGTSWLLYDKFFEEGVLYAAFPQFAATAAALVGSDHRGHGVPLAQIKKEAARSHGAASLECAARHHRHRAVAVRACAVIYP